MVDNSPGTASTDFPPFSGQPALKLLSDTRTSCPGLPFQPAWSPCGLVSIPVRRCSVVLAAAGARATPAPSSAAVSALPPVPAFAGGIVSICVAHRAHSAAGVAHARTCAAAQRDRRHATIPTVPSVMVLPARLPMSGAPRRPHPAGSSDSPVPQRPCSAVRSAPVPSEPLADPYSCRSASPAPPRPSSGTDRSS